MRKPVRLLILALSFICTGTQAFPGTGDPAGADENEEAVPKPSKWTRK